jgi:hypothetical protein
MKDIPSPASLVPALAFAPAEPPAPLEPEAELPALEDAAELPAALLELPPTPPLPAAALGVVLVEPAVGVVDVVGVGVFAGAEDVAPPLLPATAGLALPAAVGCVILGPPAVAPVVGSVLSLVSEPQATPATKSNIHPHSRQLPGILTSNTEPLRSSL